MQPGLQIWTCASSLRHTTLEFHQQPLPLAATPHPLPISSWSKRKTQGSFQTNFSWWASDPLPALPRCPNSSIPPPTQAGNEWLCLHTPRTVQYSHLTCTSTCTSLGLFLFLKELKQLSLRKHRWPLEGHIAKNSYKGTEREKLGIITRVTMHCSPSTRQSAKCFLALSLWILTTALWDRSVINPALQ